VALLRRGAASGFARYTRYIVHYQLVKVLHAPLQIAFDPLHSHKMLTMNGLGRYTNVNGEEVPYLVCGFRGGFVVAGIFIFVRSSLPMNQSPNREGRRKAADQIHAFRPSLILLRPAYVPDADLTARMQEVQRENKLFEDADEIAAGREERNCGTA
jgi:hypothetical protein